MFSITDRADSEIKKIMTKEELADSGVRIGVRMNSSSGIQYYMGFQKSPTKDDKVLNINGLTIYMDLISLTYLDGIELDFAEGAKGTGFIFKSFNKEGFCNGGCPLHALHETF